MRGADERSGELFSYVDLEARVRRDHPLRAIRAVANGALVSLERDFAGLYAPRMGRRSIAPEKLLRAMLLQAFYSIRSERQLMERIEYDLLFRWFVGLGVDDPAWDHSSFSANRDRLLAGEIAAKFLGAVLAQPRVKRLLSSDHFSVDGTLIEAWASMKSFRPKSPSSGEDPRNGSGEPPLGGGRNAEANFRGEKRSNGTHESTSDPQARLYRKGDGQPAILCYMGHALMENRNGLVVDHRLTEASGTAEREAALEMLAAQPGNSRKTVGADKAYDSADFIEACRSIGVTPHVAQNATRRASAIDERTTRHPGYAISQVVRKLIETIFGDAKQHGTLRQLKQRGLDRADQVFALAMTVVNLRRLPKLMADSG
jgi:transposase